MAWALIKLAFLALSYPSVVFSRVYFASAIEEFESFDEDVQKEIVETLLVRM